MARERAVDAVALRLPVAEAMPMISRLRNVDPKRIVMLVSGDRRQEVRSEALRSGADAAAIHQRRMREVWETARSLDAAIRSTAKIRKNIRRPPGP